MAVVVQPGFFIQVLALEAQGVVGGAGIAVAVTGLGELAPGAVVADLGIVIDQVLHLLIETAVLHLLIETATSLR
ncbi:hypothetical protein EBB56_13515 [Halomonas sp. YLB-10]|nr:hypothetical protein EBB56_13515 [Halomonas sp. YLB-10]